MNDQHAKQSEGPWPLGWLLSLGAAVLAAILARWLGDVTVAATVLVALMVFGVFCVLLAQFWEDRPSGDHDHSHGDDAGYVAEGVDAVRVRAKNNDY